MRHAVVLLLAAGVLLGAAPADAGIKQRIAAANAVERKLERTNSGYRWVASCLQKTPVTFSCEFVGIRGPRGASGVARARRKNGRYYVVLGKITFS